MKKLLMVLLCASLLTGCASAKLSDGKQSVVTFEEGGISAEELFDRLKEKYGTEEIITLIDETLLARKYTEDAEEKSYIKDIKSALKAQWKDNYETNIATTYGVTSDKEFTEYIRLVYRRNKWKSEYAKSLVTDTEINDYYNDVLVGDIEASHILIMVNSDEEESEAYAKARDIINRLYNGEDFSELAKELSDDTATKNDGGKLGTFNDRSNYDENFFEAAKNLEVGKYTTTPVKSQYGYHIIYKTNASDKPSLDTVKDEIVTVIASEKASDSTFLSTAMVALREQNKMKITDTTLKTGYDAVYGE